MVGKVIDNLARPTPPWAHEKSLPRLPRDVDQRGGKGSTMMAATVTESYTGYGPWQQSD